MLSALLAEFFGTFVFFFVIFTTLNPLYIGLTLGAMIALFAKISGGNFNPGVSMVAAYAGKLSKKLVIPYIIAQLCGGLLALFVAKNMKLLK